MAQIFTWKDEYNTGNYIIDYQHKRLLRFIGDLDDISNNEELKHSLLPIVIEELFNYAKYHFATEEGIMAQMNYSNLSEHRILHAEFVSKMLNFRKDFEDQKPDVDKSIAQYVSQWLINHIGKEDVQIIRELMVGGGAV